MFLVSLTDGLWKDRCMGETSISKLGIADLRMTPVESSIIF